MELLNVDEQRNEVMKPIEKLVLVEGVAFNMYGSIENPLFLVKDVMTILNMDVSQINKFVSRIDDDERGRILITTLGGSYEAQALTENGLYESFFMSRKPEAKKFKKLIKDLLKELRKENLQITPKFNIPQTMAEALRLAADQAEKLELAEAKIEEDKPKVAFADNVKVSENSILIGQFAKMDKRIGEKNLFKLLKNKGILISHGRRERDPKQQYIDRGYFEIDSSTRTYGSSTYTTRTTLLTGKGQVWLSNKLDEWLK